MVRSTLMLATAFFTSYASLFGQQHPPVQPGERVRVQQECTEGYTRTSNDLRTICPTHTGTFTTTTADSIVLATGDNGERMAIPIPSVTRLDVSIGQKRRWGRGALIGLAIGAGRLHAALHGLRLLQQGG